MTENQWCVYIIRTNDNQLYTGITTDVQRRWREHTSGRAGARYFRGRTPEALCYLETHHSRSTATRREADIKRLTRPQKDCLIREAGKEYCIQPESGKRSGEE